MSTRARGFGAGAEGHRFVVEVPRARGVDVRVFEDYGDLSAIEGDTRVLRALVERPRWDAMAEHARLEFNRRLRDGGRPAGNWKQGETAVERLLGKELVLLCWGGEDVPRERWEQVVANWLGLRPEERWWLHNATAAATGHPVAHRGQGWRKAVVAALSENPVVGDFLRPMFARVVPGGAASRKGGEASDVHPSLGLFPGRTVRKAA